METCTVIESTVRKCKALGLISRNTKRKNNQTEKPNKTLFKTKTEYVSFN
jgi:hypothetical protein